MLVGRVDIAATLVASASCDPQTSEPLARAGAWGETSTLGEQDGGASLDGGREVAAGGVQWPVTGSLEASVLTGGARPPLHSPVRHAALRTPVVGAGPRDHAAHLETSRRRAVETFLSSY